MGQGYGRDLLWDPVPKGWGQERLDPSGLDIADDEFHGSPLPSELWLQVPYLRDR